MPERNRGLGSRFRGDHAVMSDKPITEKRRAAVRTAIILALTAIAFYVAAIYMMADKGS